MTIVFKSNMQECIGAVEQIAARNVARATEYTRNQLIKKVSTKGDGHTYIVPNTGSNDNHLRLYKGGPYDGRLHVASSPGKPPAVLFGQLKNSFQTRYSNENGQFLGYVGPVGVEYAKPLEFGHVWDHPDGPFWTAPRPYMRPVAHENEDEIQRILRGGLVNG